MKENMNLDHEGVREKLPEYIRGTHMPDHVKVHMQTCSECREESALLEALRDVSVPEPGGLFFETLPQKVRVSLKDKKKSLSLRFAYVFALLTLVATAGYLYYTIDPSGTVEEVSIFSDPFSPQTYDLSGLTVDDIPSITEAFEEELYLSDEIPFLREFASLSSEEIEALYMALETQHNNGGV